MSSSSLNCYGFKITIRVKNDFRKLNTNSYFKKSVYNPNNKKEIT